MDEVICYCLESMSPEYAEMGLAEGGSIKQKIFPDPHGVNTWDQGNSGLLDVHIVNSEVYSRITGEPAPASPVCAETYTKYGLPWFDLYDEENADLNASSILSGLRSVGDQDIEKGITGLKPLLVHKNQVKKLGIVSKN